MQDADGKPTWGLYSGNTFWTGVPDQCRDLSNSYVYQEQNANKSENKIPPFETAVYSIKLKLQFLEPEIKQVRYF